MFAYIKYYQYFYLYTFVINSVIVKKKYFINTPNLKRTDALTETTLPAPLSLLLCKVQGKIQVQ